ncbi:MAG: dTDP-4-dehydrorhamnose 3,5-epimerase [Chloroflexi bacterium]|nr:dTDP-4-dehydrorhamnose 3,5-epimerase [Chloroflexota bacterium]MBM3182550.1 dTDP-4-dehydrorhamnose 3,5-epimerase [Chloroflexota bacterium]MBM4449668.1 dTDP-4-dehydrorhamnose 3,5-epimerase [Chloroflexota bacterium]
MLKEYPLEGVRTREINLIPDERGFFAEALRQDWNDFIDEWIAQSNLSYSYPGMVRAWHRHLRGQVDYFLVVKGAMKICAYDIATKKFAEVIGSEKKPTLVRIPGHYLHGTKTISSKPSLTFYFVTRLYDYKNPDEERVPWNSPDIIPSEINGNKNDPRVGKPWDWFHPPHK